MKRSLLKMNLAVLIAGLFLCATKGSAYSLYSDKRGKKVGDVITVLVMETSKASNESGTKTEKANSVAASGERGTGLLDFVPSFGLGGKTSANYKGQGETKREGSLKAKVTARIIEVLDNGNLVIDGSKVVEINNEREILQVSGMIRQEDVGSDNTVYSYNIADAKIVYTGNGAVYTGQRPGIFARFFNWLF
jgi:flagellar L-ring protein precursor FlgH